MGVRVWIYPQYPISYHAVSHWPSDTWIAKCQISWVAFELLDSKCILYTYNLSGVSMKIMKHVLNILKLRTIMAATVI